MITPTTQKPASYADLQQRRGPLKPEKKGQTSNINERVSYSLQNILQDSSGNYKTILNKITVLDGKMSADLNTGKLYPDFQESELQNNSSGYAELIKAKSEEHGPTVLKECSGYALDVLCASEELVNVKSVFDEYFIKLQTKIQKDLEISFELPVNYQKSTAYVLKITQEQVQNAYIEANKKAETRQEKAKELLSRIISVAEGLYESVHKVYKTVGFTGSLRDKIEPTLIEIRNSAKEISSFVKLSLIQVGSLQELAIKHTFAKKTQCIKSFTDSLQKFKHHYYLMFQDKNAEKLDVIDLYYRTIKRRYIDLTAQSNELYLMMQKGDFKQKNYAEMKTLNANFALSQNEVNRMYDYYIRGGYFVGDWRYNYIGGYKDSELQLPMPGIEVQKLDQSVVVKEAESILSSSNSNTNPFIPSNSNPFIPSDNSTKPLENYIHSYNSGASTSGSNSLGNSTPTYLEQPTPLNSSGTSTPSFVVKSSIPNFNISGTSSPNAYNMGNSSTIYNLGNSTPNPRTSGYYSPYPYTSGSYNPNVYTSGYSSPVVNQSGTYNQSNYKSDSNL